MGEQLQHGLRIARDELAPGQVRPLDHGFRVVHGRIFFLGSHGGKRRETRGIAMSDWIPVRTPHDECALSVALVWRADVLCSCARSAREDVGLPVGFEADAEVETPRCWVVRSEAD